MKSEKNIKPLSVWKLRAKDWRVENDLTTLEWNQYKEWWQARFITIAMLMYTVGAILGAIASQI